MENPDAPVIHKDELMTVPTSLDPGAGWEWRFWVIFGGQAASLIGSAMTQFVLIWWITDTTGSVSALALAGLVALLPQALLGPLGGTLADRYSRRLIMIVADLISALCMLVLIALFLRRTDRALAHLHDDVHPQCDAGVSAAGGGGQHGDAGASKLSAARCGAEPDVDGDYHHLRSTVGSAGDQPVAHRLCTVH